jgi:nucleoside-diphosphate-sugar epimerase
LLSENYVGLRQVTNKKVSKGRLKHLPKEDKKSKILLTGSTGMIGSHLAQLLESQGYKISTLSIQKSMSENSNKSYTYDDLRKGRLNLSQYDKIIHLGFSRPNSTDHETQEAIFNSFELVTQAVKSAVDQFIFISSQSVYGFSAEKIFDEESVTNPQDNYARAKLTVESFINSISKLNNETKFLIIRLASTMFPHDNKKNHESYSLMLLKLCNKENINIYAPERKLSKIDLRDALDGLAFFTQQNLLSPAETINLGPSHTETLLNFMSAAEKELGVSDKISIADTNEEQTKNSLTISSLKAELKYGWRSKYNAQETAIFFKTFLGEKR